MQSLITATAAPDAALVVTYTITVDPSTPTGTYQVEFAVRYARSGTYFAPNDDYNDAAYTVWTIQVT